MKLGNFSPIAQAVTQIPSLESIAFQKNHPGGPEFEALFVKYIDLVNKGMSANDINSDKELKLEFNALSRKHFGINAQLSTNSILAATIPNVYVPHSAVVRDALRKLLKKDTAAMGQTAIDLIPTGRDLGTVNTETAKITGWLSEQTVPMFLNFNQLVKDFNMSSAEITAVALHEFGHDFNGAASAIKFTQTNQIISDVVRHISSKDRGGDINYVYHELQKIDSGISKDTVEGLMSGEAVVMGVSAFRIIQGTVKSLGGSSVYNRSSFEALSDSFAVRMGYATPLATGLEKISRVYSAIGIFMEVVMIMGILGAITTLTMLVGTIMNGVVGYYIVLGLMVNVLNLYAMITHNRVTTGDYEYDAGNDRLNRIRQNVIEQLKDPQIDMKTRRTVLEQLAVITESQSKTINVPRPVREVLKLIFASDRMNERSIQAQQAIEKLIANDIFVSASKLAAKA